VEADFHEGKLICYAWTFVHMSDVGGRVSGSIAPSSHEIYQEGIRIPVVKLYEEGRVNDTVERIVARNVRVPGRVLGDLRAQYAAAKVGVRELTSLFDRYGRDDARAYFAELLDYAERLTRDEIRRWPKGTFKFIDYIDDDGISPEPIPINVALTVHDDHISVDYTGSSPQVRAAINSTLSYTKSCTYLSVRCALSGDVPNNAGVFRCVDIHVPPGTVLNPIEPAAVAARALTGYRVFDAMLGALAQVVPARIPAAGEGGNTVVCLSGKDQEHKPYIIVDMICGAWGARPDADGIEAITNASQNLSNTPVEVLEAQHPVRVEAYELEPDSCGPGRYRGGLGIRRSYRVLADDVLMQLRADRMKFQPYGLAGGGPARAAANILTTEGQPDRQLASKVNMTIARGDVVTHIQPGGGGFGDPMQRDLAAIERDVWNHKLSAQYVRQHYRVVTDAASGKVDAAATAALRAAGA